MTGTAATEPDPSVEPSALERRYRRLLRVLPRPYREVREQEMVDTFLDNEFGSDPENADITAKYGDVGWRETASVLALALRLRWADPVGPERYRIRLTALRMALVAVLTMYGFQTVISLLDRLRLALWPIELSGDPSPLLGPPQNQLWVLVSQWAFVLWLAAMVLTIRGGRQATWWAAGLSLVPTFVTLVRAMDTPVPSAWSWLSVLIDAGVVAGLAAVAVAGATTALPRLRGYLIAAAAAVVAWEVAAVVMLATWPTMPQLPAWSLVLLGTTLFDNIGLWTVALAVVGAAVLIRALRGIPVGTPGLLALTWFAGVISLLRAGWLLDWYPAISSDWTMWSTATLVALVVQLALAVGIAVTAGILAARRIHRLPAISYYPAGPPTTAG